MAEIIEAAVDAAITDAEMIGSNPPAWVGEAACRLLAMQARDAGL